ncbi:MAG: ABC transporter substrate-binding protein [Anaerolineae bacterium]|nr:ABC transporter substrate-binding protein [Anaerolineae bacterium]
MITNNCKFQNKKNWFTIVVYSLVIVILLSSCGAEKPKVYRVGILSGLNFVAVITDGFKAKMTELGYIEGQNIVYDVQKTDFDMAEYKHIAQKFVDDKVDLIVVFPTEATMEVKAATQGTDIPVVFTFALIEGMGIVDSVREPGGNITGVRYPGPDIALRRFEIMRELAPQAKRIWLPYQRGYPIVAPQLEILRPVAAEAGITLIEFPADNAAELQAELDARAKSDDLGLDAILFLVEPLAVTPDAFAVMGKFADEHKIPIGGALIEVEGYGVIFGVNVNPVISGELAAPLADKVLKGTPAGTIPVVSDENFLEIDYNVAQRLGVTVPDGLLSQADRVIRSVAP